MGAKITFLAPGTSDATTSSQAVLALPAAAVASHDGGYVVFQIKDDRALAVPVTTGQRLGSLIEIKDGLKEGDKVIAKVDDHIYDGSKVSVKSK
jgi:multidrug efflux pump subunit AcrA (membrane-fusion protein)